MTSESVRLLGVVLLKRISQRGFGLRSNKSPTLLRRPIRSCCSSITNLIPTQVYEIPTCDAVSRNSMIPESEKCEARKQTLESSLQTQQEGVDPDLFTFVDLHNTCANVGAVEESRHAHEEVRQINCESLVFIGSCNVDICSRFGRVDKDCGQFNMFCFHSKR